MSPFYAEYPQAGERPEDTVSVREIFQVSLELPGRESVLKRNDRTVIFIIDKFFDLIGFQDLHQCLNAFIVLISFLDGDYVDIGLCRFRIGGLIGDRVPSGCKSRFQRVVAVENYCRDFLADSGRCRD